MSKEPTKAELDAIRASAEKATEAPWRSIIIRPHGGGDVYAVNPDKSREFICSTSGNAHANANFIALTDPTTILALCDALEAKEAENVILKQRDSDTHEQFQQIKATNTLLREALIKEVVKKHDYPACGDHPDMYGWVTKADGEFGAAHVTKEEALEHYLEALKPKQKASK